MTDIIDMLASAFDAAADRAAEQVNKGTEHWIDQHENQAVAFRPYAVLAMRQQKLFEELAAIARGGSDGSL